MRNNFEEGYELYLKYRPKTFDDILGNDSVISSIRSNLDKKGRMKRVYLFSGPSGCGKSSLAEVIGNYLELNEVDIKDYNISKMRGIDTAREIIDSSIYAPMKSDYKLIILNECHKATPEFQNAMLDILEKTPKHMIFILCTTEPEKLLDTIRNRCTLYQVSPLIAPTMSQLLRNICKRENLNIRPTLLREITKVSNGSSRRALILLEKISEITDETQALAAIAEGVVDEAKTIELCRALLKKDWPTVAGVLKGLTVEPENARRAIMNYLGVVLLNTSNPDIANKMLYFSENFFDSGKSQLILSCFLACRD